MIPKAASRANARAGHHRRAPPRRRSVTFWVGLWAPRGTPKDVIAELNSAAVTALADPTVSSLLTDLGFEIYSRDQQTPEALAAYQKAEIQKWWPIIKEFGIKAEEPAAAPVRGCPENRARDDHASNRRQNTASYRRRTHRFQGSAIMVTSALESGTETAAA
jgi:hypothetical protein